MRKRLGNRVLAVDAPDAVVGEHDLNGLVEEAIGRELLVAVQYLRGAARTTIHVRAQANIATAVLRARIVQTHDEQTRMNLGKVSRILAVLTQEKRQSKTTTSTTTRIHALTLRETLVRVIPDIAMLGGEEADAGARGHRCCPLCALHQCPQVGVYCVHVQGRATRRVQHLQTEDACVEHDDDMIVLVATCTTTTTVGAHTPQLVSILAGHATRAYQVVVLLHAQL